MPPRQIAILGSGITGLSSAFYLSRKYPNALITVLEREARVGGWVRSERVRLPNGSSVLLESGPRTLRPNSKSILELINLLNLSPSLIRISRSAVASKNRYFALPGKPGLIRFPNSLKSLWRFPYRSLFIWPMIREAFRGYNRPPGITDESVDSFFTRRFGEWHAETMGSAIVHGIYAGDSRKLSLRAAFPQMWEVEEDGNGSIIRGMLKKKHDHAAGAKSDSGKKYDLGDVGKLMDEIAVYSFQEGIGSVTNALVETLRKNPNVTIKTNVDVASIKPASEGVEIQTTSGETFNASHAVSSVRTTVLHTLIPQPFALPHLNANPYSNVVLLNLIYPKTPDVVLHPPGFGYLVPRPPVNFFYVNPGILGVIFDSVPLASQDSGPPVTKMTVMMGGPHQLRPSDLALPTILRHVAAQIGLKRGDKAYDVFMQPIYHKMYNHKECIPTLTLGHIDRVRELRESLKSDPWQGRLEVIGSGVDGVSVGDCIESGRNVGASWA